MNPLSGFKSTNVEKKRRHDQAFGGSDASPTHNEPTAKRSKICANSLQFDSRASSCLLVRNDSSDRELIDLCSESSDSYKTAEDRSPSKVMGVKYYSDISIGSTSNALDLSTKSQRPKRLTTITLSSTDDDADVCKSLIGQRISETQFPKNPKLQAGNLNLNLQVVCLLGTGGYGKVFLVRTKENLDKYYDESAAKTSESSTESGVYSDPEPTKSRRKRGKDTIQYVRNTAATNEVIPGKVRHDSLNYYALKVIKKSNVLKSQTDLRHLKMEQRILARIQHPFIVQCHLAVQTDKQLFFISEYIQGGELFNLLDRFAPLDESDSAFYMSEVLVALEYLHSQQIIYRDLKPENIMLMRDGHVKLVDFGLSRDNFPGAGFDIVTATKCGTKEYMAPEVYRKEPYGLAADWWSFGAVSFDLMTNKVPIVEQDYEKAIEFPSSMSRLAKDLLKRLMTVDHRYRLGSLHGATAIARHPFFNGINWDSVEQKRLTPPFRLNGIPEPGDFSCFSRKVTSKRRRVCSETKKSFVDPKLQFHFENFDYVQGCDINRISSK